MSRIVTIFFDAGGVCLTNGWDIGARPSAAVLFALDLGGFEHRYQAPADALDRGGLAEQLLNARVEVPASGPVSARVCPGRGERPRRDETAAREERRCRLD